MIKLDVPKATEIFSFSFMDFTNLFSLGEHVERLCSPQCDFKHDGHTISNALLVHRLVATGKGEQVVSRRDEINRDLVKRTCTMSGVSEMRCRDILWLEPETTCVQLQLVNSPDILQSNSF